MTVVLLIALVWLLLGAVAVVLLNVAKHLVSTSPVSTVAHGPLVARPTSGAGSGSAGGPSSRGLPAPCALPTPLAATRSQRA